MDKELVVEWLKHADDNIDTALLLKEMRPQHYEIICYHCEQAVEKYLKGFLVFKGKMPPKTHDLNNLCTLCSEQDNSFQNLQPQCSYLTPFAVQPKYPNDLDITDADVEKAVKFALEVKNFGVIEKLRGDMGSG